MVIFVSRTNAVDNGNTLRISFHVSQNYLATRWPRRINHTLKFQASEDVIKPFVSILRNSGTIEKIKAGRENDIPDFKIEYLVFLLKINRIWRCRAEDLASASGRR